MHTHTHNTQFCSQWIVEPLFWGSPPEVYISLCVKSKMGSCVTPQGFCKDPSGWKAGIWLSNPPSHLGSPEAKLSVPSGVVGHRQE